MTWIANLLIVMGLYLAGNKHRAAFGFTIVGELIWSIVAATKEQWDLAFICTVFTGLAVVNLWKWNKEYK
jgi:hypothetical protein